METNSTDLAAADQPINVLVVDGERPSLEATKVILGDKFSVQTCTDPLTALSMLEQGNFDVLCTEQSMPGMSGMELIDRARALPSAPIPILMTPRAQPRPEIPTSNPLASAPLALLLKPCAPEKLRLSVGLAAALGRLRRARLAVPPDERS